jgi:hypothetical protein
VFKGNMALDLLPPEPLLARWAAAPYGNGLLAADLAREMSEYVGTWVRAPAAVLLPAQSSAGSVRLFMTNQATSAKNKALYENHPSR